MSDTYAVHRLTADGGRPQINENCLKRTDGDPTGYVYLDGHFGNAVISDDPAVLRALARVFDEAAVRLSAELDVRAARQINATAAA